MPYLCTITKQNNNNMSNEIGFCAAINGKISKFAVQNRVGYDNPAVAEAGTIHHVFAPKNTDDDTFVECSHRYYDRCAFYSVSPDFSNYIQAKMGEHGVVTGDDIFLTLNDFIKVWRERPTVVTYNKKLTDVKYSLKLIQWVDDMINFALELQKNGETIYVYAD